LVGEEEKKKRKGRRKGRTVNLIVDMVGKPLQGSFDKKGGKKNSICGSPERRRGRGQEGCRALFTFRERLVQRKGKVSDVIDF